MGSDVILPGVVCLWVCSRMKLLWIPDQMDPLLKKAKYQKLSFVADIKYWRRLDFPILL